MRLTLAANNGDMGGGEVMLLAMAEAARELGHDVEVVAPASPGELAGRARGAGFRTVEIAGAGRLAYLTNLRAWDRAHRQGWLWCHGLVPATATAGHRDRVVHLHQLPRSRRQRAFLAAARPGAERIVVPSRFMASRVSGAHVLENWTASFGVRSARPSDGDVVVGFLGRLSVDKGILVLCEALELLRTRRSGRYRGVLAGDARLADDDGSAIAAAVDRLGDAVVRPGWLDRLQFANAVDLAVFPSIFPESFGLVVAEAMSARLPFVASDVGALPEVGGPGRIYPRPGDATALADAIEATLAEPDRTQVGYDRWLTMFSPEAGRARLAEVLASLT